MALARGDGNRAATQQVLRVREGRRLEAERELWSMSGALMFSATILTDVMVLSSAHQPAWVRMAWETGEQLLRARLCKLLNVSVFALAMALVGVLCAHRMVPAAPAERALATARALYGSFLALLLAWVAVFASDSWGETAAALCIEFASAAFAFLLYLGVGDVKRGILSVGKALGLGCFIS